jgi:hypothetical protein
MVVVDVSKGLPIAVARDEARAIVFDDPSRRKVALGHSFLCAIEFEHFDGGLVVGLMQVDVAADGVGKHMACAGARRTAA